MISLRAIFHACCDDPRERPVLAVGLLLDLAQHVLGEVEALLPFVGTCHQILRRRLAQGKGSHNGSLCLDVPDTAVK